MKSYVLAFAICFAVIDLSFALGKEDQEKCLRKNGLNNSSKSSMKPYVRCGTYGDTPLLNSEK
ncbi:hypothetical protein TSAR_006830 [Trichomalopsis sarcophagae]|uniref:Uncharacterized protein n=1 Tax=Trichomalopsis sarcophagae TaxID=543379 RepID=A0A232FFN6_9HYME|nr:hypothetical protein TSAR_006830 [Trichomalopsis sarcophagae]